MQRSDFECFLIDEDVKDYRAPPLLLPFLALSKYTSNPAVHA